MATRQLGCMVFVGETGGGFRELDKLREKLI